MSDVEIKGIDVVIAALRRVGGDIRQKGAAALFQEAEIEMTYEIKRRTPVDHGPLRASEHVQRPQFDRDGVSVSLVAGGPSAEYALIVHEDLDAFHDDGEAQYLIGPLLEAAPHLAARIARRIVLR